MIIVATVGREYNVVLRLATTAGEPSAKYEAVIQIRSDGDVVTWLNYL